jgi:serine/threonine-protein kinase PpkA
VEIPGYRILRQLGRGGMATVYLALQESVEREVALKVMSPYLLTDPTFGERFLREARIAAKMTHRHIVQVHDVGRAGDHHYIAMEFLSAGEVIDKSGAGLDVPSVLRISKEIASALGYAHAKGFVHRDVKPDNILKRDDGAAVLTDFGIARAADSQTHMTKTGSVIGTPHYMSPEQARGRAVDGRADLYSLGVVFHEMLMGRVPYTAEDSLAVGIMHITQPIPELPTSLAALQPLLKQMLAKEPDARFQTGDELVDAIEAIEQRIHAGEFPRWLDPLPQTTRIRPPSSLKRTRPATPVTLKDARVEPTLGALDAIDNEARHTRLAPPTRPPRRWGWWLVFSLLLIGFGTAAWLSREHRRSGPPPVVTTTPSPVVPVTTPEPPPPPPPRPFQSAVQLLPSVQAAITRGALIDGEASALALVRDGLLKSPTPTDLAAATEALERALAAALTAATDDAQATRVIEAWRSFNPDAAALKQLSAERDAQRAATARSQELAARLAAFAEARRAGRLLGARSASAEYDAALALDRNDPRVRALKPELVSALIERAQRALADRELDRAAPLLARAEALDARAPGLPAAQLKLAALREDSATPPAPDPATQAEIDRLLAEAAQHVAAGDLNNPPLDNAFDKYKQVQRVDPNNAAARAGLAALPGEFSRRFDRALAEGDVVKADEYFGGLGAIGRDNAQLANAKSRLIEAYASAIDAARAENRTARAENYLARFRQLAPGDPRGL